jgi:hypothetical protein
MRSCARECRPAGDNEGLFAPRAPQPGMGSLDPFYKGGFSKGPPLDGVGGQRPSSASPQQTTTHAA